MAKQQDRCARGVPTSSRAFSVQPRCVHVERSKQAVAVVLLVAAITLTGGFLLKNQCLERNWDGIQYSKYCYSDPQALYKTYGIDDGKFPYTETFNEYPPVTGLYAHFAGEAGWSKDSYFRISMAGLGVMALATTYFLARMASPRTVLWWAASPALFLFAFQNWDLLAIFLTVAGVYAMHRKHPGVAGVMLGLGTAAKLFPVLVAVPLGVATLATWRPTKATFWLTGGFAAAWLGVHVPLALAPDSQLWEAYRFQFDRGPNFESLWFVLGHWGRQIDYPWLADLGKESVAGFWSPVLICAVAGLTALAVFFRRMDAVTAAMCNVLALVAFNQVLSVQYSLWALPFLVLVPVPDLLRTAYTVVSCAVVVVLFSYFLVAASTSDPAAFQPVVVMVVARAAIFVLIIAWALDRAFFRKPTRPGTPPPVRVERPDGIPMVE